jgi:hypothetical protein
MNNNNRFDFSHTKGVKTEEIVEIEKIVNDVIRSRTVLTTAIAIKPHYEHYMKARITCIIKSCTPQGSSSYKWIESSIWRSISRPRSCGFCRKSGSWSVLYSYIRFFS